MCRQQALRGDNVGRAGRSGELAGVQPPVRPCRRFDGRPRYSWTVRHRQEWAIPIGRTTASRGVHKGERRGRSRPHPAGLSSRISRQTAVSRSRVLGDGSMMTKGRSDTLLAQRTAACQLLSLRSKDIRDWQPLPCENAPGARLAGFQQPGVLPASAGDVAHAPLGQWFGHTAHATGHGTSGSWHRGVGGRCQRLWRREIFCVPFATEFAAFRIMSASLVAAGVSGSPARWINTMAGAGRCSRTGMT